MLGNRLIAAPLPRGATSKRMAGMLSTEERRPETPQPITRRTLSEAAWVLAGAGPRRTRKTPRAGITTQSAATAPTAGRLQVWGQNQNACAARAPANNTPELWKPETRVLCSSATTELNQAAMQARVQTQTPAARARGRWLTGSEMSDIERPQTARCTNGSGEEEPVLAAQTKGRGQGLTERKDCPGSRRRATTAAKYAEPGRRLAQKESDYGPDQACLIMPWRMARTMKSAGGVVFSGTILPKDIHGLEFSAEA